MSETSGKSKQLTLFDSDDATGSPEFSDGNSPCKLPDGPPNAPCGLAPAPVSHSAPPASGRERRTIATCGLFGSISSASRALSASLANKLRERLNMDGSTEFVQTWKRKVTPSGRPYWAHTARARRTSDSDCSGWPTPDHHGRGDTSDPEAIRQRLAASKRADSEKRQLNLQEAAQLAGCSTPRASDGEKGGPNQTGETLTQHAMLTGWATPAARDHKDGACQEAEVTVNALLGRQAAKLVSPPSGETPSSSTAKTGKPVACRLNPLFSLWLMGYPVAWASCAVRAMQSCRKSRRSS